MEFKIGRLRLKATGLSLFENWLELIRNEPFKSRKTDNIVFRWDCATGKGHPSQPLKPALAHCHLVFHVLNPLGKPDIRAEGRMLDRFVVASGLRTRAAFSKAFDKKLPSASFPIDEAKLINPFKQKYKFHVTAIPEQNHFVVRANGGRPGDFAFLSIPWHVYLNTKCDGTCGDINPPKSGFLAFDSETPRLNKLQKDLNKQHRSDLEESIRRHRKY